MKAEHLCARIDPRPYQVIVDSNAANLASAEAQLGRTGRRSRTRRSTTTATSISEERAIASQDAVDGDESAVDRGATQIGVLAPRIAVAIRRRGDTIGIRRA